jgi:hypothetical protein
MMTCLSVETNRLKEQYKFRILIFAPSVTLNPTHAAKVIGQILNVST